MYRTNRYPALFLVLSLLLAPVVHLNAESELIPEDQIKTKTVRYNTEQVSFGTFEITSVCNGSTYIPVVQSVLYEGETAKCVETMVGLNDVVAQGDILMSVQVEFDEIAEKELELRLQRAKESRDKTDAAYQKSISKLQTTLNTEEDPYEQQKLSLQIRKTQLEKERYLYQENKTIADLEKELEEQKENMELRYITAPVSGTVYDLTYYTEDSYISEGDSIAVIADLTSSLVQISNTDYSFGSEVSMEVSVYRNKIEFPGTVVVSSKSIPDAASEFSLISIDFSDYLDSNGKLTSVDLQTFIELMRTSILVSGSTIRLQNVLLIPSDARYSDDDKYYVYTLDENQSLHKRYIKVGLMNPEYTWVLLGLSEGETVVLDQ